MKKFKIILIAFSVLTVAGILAFKSHGIQGGPLYCQETPGTCTDIATKYIFDSENGMYLYCCTGMPGDQECIHRVKVMPYE